MSTNNLIIHHISVGDTRTPLGMDLVQLDEDGVERPLDLTGMTVKVLGSKDDKTSWFVEDEDRVTVVDADAGRILVKFTDDDVETKGTYWLWVRVYDGDDEHDTFPCDGRKRQVQIHDVQ